MLIEKLSTGVLRVTTSVGPRYIKPAFAERLYLLWMFRHFEMLPLQVLSKRQQRLVNALCSQHRFVSAIQVYGEDTPVLGTVDWHPQIENREPEHSGPSAGLRAAVARLAGAVHYRSW